MTCGVASRLFSHTFYYFKYLLNFMAKANNAKLKCAVKKLIFISSNHFLQSYIAFILAISLGLSLCLCPNEIPGL